MKRVLTTLLILILSFFICPITVQGKEKVDDSLVETISDDEYYSKTTIYRTKDCMYNNTKKLSCNDYLQNSTKEFVLGITKEVVVQDIIDEFGIVSSKLLKQEEIEASLLRLHVSDSYYYLTITLLVEQSGDYYYVSGTADWQNKAIMGGVQTAEEGTDDFLAITWGGNGELMSLSNSFSGYYYNNNAIPAAKCLSDSYGGYCWRFIEKTGIIFGSPMRTATADVLLTKTYQQMQNKQTNVKMTYIHTYTSFNPTASFSLGTNNVAATVTITPSTNSWSIQVDVPGLMY